MTSKGLQQIYNRGKVIKEKYNPEQIYIRAENSSAIYSLRENSIILKSSNTASHISIIAAYQQLFGMFNDQDCYDPQKM